MIAVETNILLYLRRRGSDWRVRARQAIVRLAEDHASRVVPSLCIHESLTIVTRPRTYDPPAALEKALSQVETWFESPSPRLWGELKGHWNELKEILPAARITGECCSADSDVARMKGLAVRNPLLSDR